MWLKSTIDKAAPAWQNRVRKRWMHLEAEIEKISNLLS
jgi:hypothetical protein